MKKNGFTLLEVMVVIGLFGVLVTILTTVVVQAIIGANRANITNDVRQNAQAIMSDIGSEVRKSSCVQIGSSGNTTQLMVYSDSGCTVLTATYTSNSTDKTFTKKPASSPEISLISSNVAALTCKASETSCSTTSCTDNGLTLSLVDGELVQSTNGVKVRLTVQQVPGKSRSDFCGSITLEDTFTPRN